jgi:hypothetical protein
MSAPTTAVGSSTELPYNRTENYDASQLPARLK